MSIEIEKNISKFVSTQLPDFYREEGPQFIAFVKAYYEWLESKQFEYKPRDAKDSDPWTVVDNPSATLHHSRNLTNYRDIDNTLDEFILDFKNKYLPNIQFNIATNKKLFIKNALEFYRAKGTERAVDLFFKLVYGLEARVYEPARDLFKLSDNEWENKRYLEMVPSPINVGFIGRQIYGDTSKATAFAERLVRVKKGSLFVEVIYLSALNGVFQTNEQIRTRPEIGSDIVYQNEVIGSLTSLEINATDPNFVVGEEVVVEGGKGKKARAIVTSIESEVGVVSFDILDHESGWGYSADSLVIGADRELLLDDITVENTDYFYHVDPFQRFKSVHQDLSLITFDQDNSNAAAYTLGTDLLVYHNGNTASNVVFNCTIVEVNTNQDYIIVNYIKSNYVNSNNEIQLDDGNLFHSNVISSFYTSDGAELVVDTTANIVDASISGNVIATSNTLTLEYTTTGQPLIGGDILYQKEETAGVRYVHAVVANTFANTTSGQLYANVIREKGFFRTNKPFYRNRVGEIDLECNITKLSNVQIGIINNGTELQGGIPFKKLANTYTSNTELGSYASGSSNNNSFSFTNKASFKGPESSLSDTQDYFYYETTTREGGPFYINLLDIASTNIGDILNYDTGNPNSVFEWIASGNQIQLSNTVLSDALNYTNTAISVGSLEQIVVTNPGEGYGIAPSYIVFDPLAFHTERYDFYIKYYDEGADNIRKAFRLGEIVKSAGKDNAFGRIMSFDITKREMKVTRLFASQDVTANSDTQWSVDEDFRIGDTLEGQTSGVAVTIEVVDELRMHPRVGLNAVINTETLSGDGFATSLRVIDSGIGYFGRQLDPVTDTYVRGEPLVLRSVTDSNKSISVYGYLGQNGIAPGVHPNRKSFLSSDKYLHDNDFYQEYSYQVLTSLPFSKYKQTLIDVLHLSGSKPFGGFVGTSESPVGIDATQSSTTWNIKQYGLFVNENTFYTNTTVST